MADSEILDIRAHGPANCDLCQMQFDVLYSITDEGRVYFCQGCLDKLVKMTLASRLITNVTSRVVEGATKETVSVLISRALEKKNPIISG